MQLTHCYCYCFYEPLLFLNTCGLYQKGDAWKKMLIYEL